MLINLMIFSSRTNSGRLREHNANLEAPFLVRVAIFSSHNFEKSTNLSSGMDPKQSYLSMRRRIVHCASVYIDCDTGYTLIETS